MMTLTGCLEAMPEAVQLHLDAATIQRLARNRAIQKMAHGAHRFGECWPQEMPQLDQV